jgi:hypothetical protein
LQVGRIERRACFGEGQEIARYVALGEDVSAAVESAMRPAVPNADPRHAKFFLATSLATKAGNLEIDALGWRKRLTWW